MSAEWIQHSRETRRTFARSTWIPLRANVEDLPGSRDATELGYRSDVFACGSVAFPPEHKSRAEELGWGSLGIGHSARPYAYQDGYYSPIDQFQDGDKEPIGVELVFEHPQPVIGGSLWVLNPDLVVALGLVKEGSNWVRPEEDFTVVARETVDSKGVFRAIEIKREFLMDYLAARNLSLRLSYYRQRVENVEKTEGTEYSNLSESSEARDGGRFELLIRDLNDVFGGGWSKFRMWRTDIDEDEDAPKMGPEDEENTAYETTEGHQSGYVGVRVEGEFWRDEWIEHQNKSVRVRGDAEENLPQFIVDTDGTRLPSEQLNDDDVGSWLWFRPEVVNDLLSHRGFSIEWFTAETGGIRSTSGYRAHFGLNGADLVTVYAHDIARLNGWEQRIWAASNVVPEGKVSAELLAAQVRTMPASTIAPEVLLLRFMRMLEAGFKSGKYGISLFNHDVDDEAVLQRVSRFVSVDRSSLLRLAKELIRVFSDRLDQRELRRVSAHANKEKLGSNKLLQDLVAQRIGEERARDLMGPIFGAYEMRVGDAHPTSSAIDDSLDLVGIDRAASYLRQGEQLISNFTRSIFLIGRSLFADARGEKGGG